MLINVVAVKYFDNRGVTRVDTFLEECNKVSIVTHRVKGQSVKIPVQCRKVINKYDCGTGGVDFIDLKRAVYKLDHRSPGGRYCFRLFFNLMYIFVVK